MTIPSHRDNAIQFLTLVAEGRVREAYESYVGPEFRHHNPSFRGDAGSLMAAMEENAVANPGTVLEIRRSLQDGDQVAVFSHLRQAPGDTGWAVVHIFRFEGDRIVEVWDVGQDVPETSVNENGMF